MVPTIALPPATPLTAHVTGVVVLPEIIVLNCNVFPRTRLTVIGVTVREVDAATRLTFAEADKVVFVCETAMIVTVVGLGRLKGAVYKPVVEMIPIVEFPPGVPFTCHVTAEVERLLMFAANCNVADVGILALSGEIEIDDVALVREVELSPHPMPTTLSAIANATIR